MTKRHEKTPCWQVVKMTANLQTADQGPELQCLLKLIFQHAIINA